MTKAGSLIVHHISCVKKNPHSILGFGEFTPTGRSGGFRWASPRGHFISGIGSSGKGWLGTLFIRASKVEYTSALATAILFVALSSPQKAGTLLKCLDVLEIGGSPQ